MYQLVFDYSEAREEVRATVAWRRYLAMHGIVLTSNGDNHVFKCLTKAPLVVLFPNHASRITEEW